MKLKVLFPLVATLGACSVTPRAPEAGAPPWTFNAPAASGYSIALVTADPRPGTPLVAGTVVDFKVTVSYTLSISTHGRIALVFQDEKDGSVKSNDPRAYFEVNDSANVASLANRVTVPSSAKELRVFVPITPEGVKRTTGEVTIRYPIITGTR